MKLLKKISVFLFCIFMLAGCTCEKDKPVENKLVIWHWITDRREAFDILAKKYQAETGTEIEFKLFFPPDIYGQKVIAAARAGTLPDIFGILGDKKTVARFVRAGHILDLSEYMAADNLNWRSKFYPQTLIVAEFKKDNVYKVKHGIYGVPIDTNVMQFVYNKKLFVKAGLDPNKPPKTLNEFIEYAKIIQKKTGAVGFISGWGEGWLLNALAVEWAINIMGEKKFAATMAGKVSYNDEDWLAVFTLFEQLRNENIFPSNIATMTNKEAEDAFAKDKAGFSFNGSWAVNVYSQINPKIEYGFFSLPIVNTSNPIKVWGGGGSIFRVNADSANKEKAVAFLKWLTGREQQNYLVTETNNLAANRYCEKNLPQVLKGLTKSFNNFTHPDNWQKNEDSRVVETFNKGLQQIVMGLKTAVAVAHEVQSKKNKVMK